MILNEKVFVKSVILKKNFFVLSDFESKFFGRVRFRIDFSTTRQILNKLPKSPPHVIFTLFSSISQWTVTAYNILIN